MRRTELKYWANGYQVRGGKYTKTHRTLAFRILTLGVMLSSYGIKPGLTLYRLEK